MTLGKNFRLPTDVKPTAYDADLRLDLNADRFEGELAIDVALGAARRAITVHAVGLEVREASAEVGRRGRSRRKATADAESETVTLAFAEELPAGAARVRIAYRGAFSPGLRGLYRAGSIAVTQFEAADARRLFPCFDEPAFKAVWRLRVGGVPEPGDRDLERQGHRATTTTGSGGRRRDVRADAAAVVVPGGADRRAAGGEPGRRWRATCRSRRGRRPRSGS